MPKAFLPTGWIQVEAFGFTNELEISHYYEECGRKIYELADIKFDTELDDMISYGIVSEEAMMDFLFELALEKMSGSE